MHPKITILGCGLAGMITALGLAKRDIPVTIIESRSSKDNNFFKDVRTTALTSSSKSVLQDIDIWGDLEKYTGCFNDIYVADNKSNEMLHFSSEKIGSAERMGHLIENTNFKQELFALASSNELITILENTSYVIEKNTSEECKLLLNNKEQHNCDLLIVCDGSASLAKQQYFSSQTEKAYNQHAITFVIRHEIAHEGTAVEHFMPSGPFAILPLKNQHLSSIVWSVESDKLEAIMNLPREELTYLVQQNAGDFLGTIQIENDAAAFPLKIYETKKYYNKKIVLVSDSAHIMHPLAGQGLNQGIKDISNLINNIVKFKANQYALEQYQKERQADNSHMLEATDLLNTIFSNHSRVLHGFRKLGFKAIENTPFLKSKLIKYAMGQR